MKYYPFIDGLRAIAVLSVIFFHFGLLHVPGGYVGVDIFFVISGFLITGIIHDRMQQNKFSLLHFYERRARRILPALFITCFLSAAVALALFLPNDLVFFAKSLKGVSLFGSNFVFARYVDYFADTQSVKPLLHTWSLAVEEQFYVAFPLILYGFSRFKKNSLHLGIFILFVISLALNISLVDSSPEKTFYLLHTRAWELLAGSLLALNMEKLRFSAPVRETLGLAGILMLLACFLGYSRDTVFPGIAAILPVLGASLLIAANIHGGTTTGKILSSAPFVKTGLISYGLYLYHWPVLIFARYYLDRDLTAADSMVAISLVVILSVLSYIFAEHPIRSGKMLVKRRTVFVFSAAGLAILLIAALLMIRQQGFPSRFSGDALQYAAGQQDTNWSHLACSESGISGLSEKTICSLGDGTRKSPGFILWGDSHAGSIAPAVDALARERGIRGWVTIFSGCPSLLNVERADRHISFSCKEANDKILETVRSGKIKDVLIVNRWDMYALGWEKGGLETTRTPQISFHKPDGTVLTGKEAFRASVDETIRQLRALHINIWILKQIPPHLIHAPTALAKAVFLGHDLGRLNRPYQEILERRRFIDETFSAYEGRRGIYFIDPMEKFCTKEDGCRIADSGKSLYIDAGHLSVYGAMWSRGMLKPFFISLPGKNIARQ